MGMFEKRRCGKFLEYFGDYELKDPKTHKGASFGFRTGVQTVFFEASTVVCYFRISPRQSGLIDMFLAVVTAGFRRLSLHSRLVCSVLQIQSGLRFDLSTSFKCLATVRRCLELLNGV